MKSRIQLLLTLFILIAVKTGYAQQAPRQTEYLTFPFSEYVIRSDWAMPIVWKYRPFADIKENETVIAPPAPGQNWETWYKRMKEYQAYLRSHLNDTSALYLQMTVSKGKSVRLHYKRVLNEMRLKPNDKITFDGYAKDSIGVSKFRIGLMYIKIGQEKSHAVIKTQTVDSTIITTNWTSLHHEFRLPKFDTATVMVQPVVYFDSDNTTPVQVQIKDLKFSIPANKFNNKIYEKMQASFYPKSKAIDLQLYDRKEMQWTKSNFISGFAYLWDQDFWDADKKVFTVQKYCDKMKKQFGGFQSVLFWYSYPNLGIDQRNTWDFLNDLPGGINSLKAIVKTFHDNGVKVYFPYTSWEIDTHKTNNLTDPQHWAKVIGETDADGLFFDVFFDAGDFQKDLDKVKKGISIGTEHHPSLQNIQSYNGLTTSWGQTIQPYHNNGISRAKWLIPAHMQWKINRNELNRQNSMAYSWINGQGILIWENVFGYMNPWNVADRKDLRKINAIYQQFAGLYTSDSWKPYLPTEDAKVHLSSWENNDYKIWNIITDSVNAVKQVAITTNDVSMQYYDLWNGEKLAVINNQVAVPINRFACVVGIKGTTTLAFNALISKQNAETALALPVTDPHMAYLDDKFAKNPTQINIKTKKINVGKLLTVSAGTYTLLTKHFMREGGCFPDADAKNNNAYHLERNSFGKELIVHHEQINTPGFSIMAKVVTNGQFDEFIKATNYKPADDHNFLKHWNGGKCADSIKSKPVVYVSLDDARAYAAWAGTRLPNEWEWQLAGQQNNGDFIFNEVWEWNESERYDGHNHFVTLRGGCATWMLQTSDWYFPGTPNNKKPGGQQPLDSHCKYYIMKAGYDRAATIGFRCLR
jgi:iron(II)-dependent oxidoreductase